MVKAVLTETSVQWFVDSKNYKDPFLEYDFKADELKIHDERLYYLEGIWIGFEFNSFSDILNWFPRNGTGCTDSVRLYIIEKIYNKRCTYNLMTHVFVSTQIIRFANVKTTLDKDNIKWFSAYNAYKEPFLEYNINSYDLKVNDKDICIFERYDALYDSDFATKYSIEKDWYPENCSDSLKMIISDIIHHGYLTKEDIEFYKKFQN